MGNASVEEKTRPKPKPEGYLYLYHKLDNRTLRQRAHAQSITPYQSSPGKRAISALTRSLKWLVGTVACRIPPELQITS